MNATAKPVKIRFHMEECRRCGGAGTHLYNQRDGRVCWGCNGNKERLSRLGRTAFDAYEKALNNSAARVAVKDLAPGMRIHSQAHGGLVGAVPCDLPAAWRTVAAVTITERTQTGAGVTDDGFLTDVIITDAEILFEDGKTWTASTSEDPAYWRKGAAHSIYTRTHFDVSGEEAQAARDTARIEIARRYKGAWLDGEEPPAAPRLRKSADMDKPKPLPENLYAGDCHKCGGHVGAKEGERIRLTGRWGVQHKGGICPEPPAAEEPQESAAPKPERIMPNRYGGLCARPGCGQWVGEEKGERVLIDGEWSTRHRDGDCPPVAGDPVTEEGMYRRADGEIFAVVRGRVDTLYARRFVPPAEEGGGASFAYDRAALATLSESDRMTVEQAADIGRELHVCIRCGDALTDPKSVARGIGPVCAKKV
ncbi:DUF6011 domain-containing protein [Streptomyces sp. NPDC088752]|uniref:DUF6011 domain-containing protein n=1 Tax=Streptomyces sp. NPDC088752 TaxID=3154963 RepID=UPI0034186649